MAEGWEVLDALNEALTDDSGRPYQNIRIRHTITLDDPFEDAPQLEEHIPEASPEPVFEHGDRLEDDWAPHQVRLCGMGLQAALYVQAVLFTIFFVMAFKFCCFKISSWLISLDSVALAVPLANAPLSMP